MNPTHDPPGTILGLLIPWLIQGRPRLASFDDNQTIAFISDLGAFDLKPLFIAGAFATAALYVASLLANRALQRRHAPGATCGEHTLTVFALVGSSAGGTAVGLLAIFDNFRFTQTHDRLLVVFIAGNLLSAAALVAEYGLVTRHRDRPPAEQRLVVVSFYMKLIYLVLEIAATVAFVLFGKAGNIDLAAVFEYVSAALFAWFIFSFVMDLRMARRGYQPMPKEPGRRGLGV